MTSRQPHLARRLLSFPVISLVVVVFLIAPASHSSAQEEDSASSDLSQAIEDYLNAQDELAALEQEQEDLEAELEDSEAEVTQLQEELGEYAYIAYTASDLQSTAALMSSGNPSDAVDAMTSLQFLGESRADRLGELIARLDEIEATQETLDDNIAEQEQLTADLESARDAAALELAASGGDAATGPSPGNFPAPDPAPRNSDGTLPSESCTETDPTTGGCLTPRTLHALEQTVLAGFTRYTKCYRNDSWGEHPQGRACDLSANIGDFGGDAYGENRTYGDDLAAWYVENADALGVQYVIWYRQIWQPATGWRTYNLAGGDPSSDHTNHVHLSIR